MMRNCLIVIDMQNDFLERLEGVTRAALLLNTNQLIDVFRASDCPDIWGDDIERKVQWNDGADVGRLKGQPIRLRFVLKDADVYAFRFAR